MAVLSLLGSASLTVLAPLTALFATAPSEMPVPTEVQQGADATVAMLGVEMATVVTVTGAFVFGWLLMVVLLQLTRVIFARRRAFGAQVRRLANPLGVALGFLLARLALGATAATASWFPIVSFLLIAALVAALGWAALRVVALVEQRVLDKYREAGINDRRDRKIRTQTVLIRRILQAVIVTVAVAIILLTIPAVRSLGAGLLASAGLISVVAALAVQSTLTNVFAGVQLAFTDSIRVGDVVNMEGTFGTIEDITLSNVVVKLWDGRRMIYPSSHFTTVPFENWTRVGSELSGVVEFDVDWRVPMDDLRARLKQLVASTELWDGRDVSMQVTDASGGMVRIRAVVSAGSSGDLWDLRCLVREDLVSYIRTEHPEAVVTQRMSEAQPSGALTGALPPVLVGAAGDHDDDASSAAEGRSVRGEGRGDRRGADRAVREDAAGGDARRGVDVSADASQYPARSPEDTRAGSMPVTPRRAEAAPAPQPVATTAPLTKVTDDSSMFTGSITAVERNREFSGPGEDAYAERRAHRDAE
ncbi:MAG: mechanosensitive ion channel [Micrococcus sp.]|nr:mechanosensitive ion channel [Micrococcus sp.]